MYEIAKCSSYFIVGKLIFYDIYLEFISWRRWSKMELPQIFWSIIEDLYKIHCFSLFAYQPVSVKDGDVPTIEAISTGFSKPFSRVHFQFHLWSELYFIGLYIL